MGKIKLLGIGRSGKHSHYVIPKKQDFFRIAREIMKELKMIPLEYESFGRPLDKNGEPRFGKEDRVKEYTDRIYHFENKNHLMEIVFGKDRIFLQIHSKNPKKISEMMLKYFK